MMDLKKAIDIVEKHVSDSSIGVYADTHELRMAYDIVLAAGHMRTPKKVIAEFQEIEGARSAKYRCPACRRGLYAEYATDIAAGYTTKGMKGRFCHRCGQELDWSVIGEKNEQ